MISEALLLSLKLASLTTGILLVVGMPLAYALAVSRGRFKPLLEATVALPVVLPPTVLGFYMLLAMGPHGFLGAFWGGVFHERLPFTFTGLLLASACYSLPFAVQPMQAAFQGLNPRLLEVSWTLGVSRLSTFVRVVLPLAMPGVLTSAVLTFAHTLGEFGVVLMVGGNIPGETKTLSIAIYDLVEALDYGRAGQLSLALLVLSYLLLVVVYVFNKKVFQLWQQA